MYRSAPLFQILDTPLVVWIRLYAQLLTMLRILGKHLLNFVVHQLMIDDDSNDDDDSHDPDDPQLVDIAGILANDADSDDYIYLHSIISPC
jgi:hypothetical protein